MGIRRKTPIGSRALNGGESIYLDDIFLSEQLIEHIDEELFLSRVYAAGYSNGGMWALISGYRRV